MATAHVPVMLRQVLTALAPAAGEVHVDGTFGGGGYSRAILEAADCRVIAIDRDADAVARGRSLARRYAGRLTVLHGRFAEMQALAGAAGAGEVNGVVLDLGLSSDQLADAGRGFSFTTDGPLDMRMSAAGDSAADVVNGLPEAALADIIWRYGEERASRRVARAIVRARERSPIRRTGELAEIVAGAVGRAGRIHPATRTFQALRIYVNQEIDELQRGLHAAERLLLPDGRLVVVSFHSLEDREVKRFLAARSGRRAGPSRHAPPAAGPGPVPTFRMTKAGAIAAEPTEVEANPRARSARLRFAVRTGAPAQEAA